MEDEVCERRVERFRHQLVECLAQPTTPILVNDVLKDIRHSIHPHVDRRVVWRSVYRFVRAHKRGCTDGCRHMYNHIVLAENALWVLAYLKELSLK